RDRTQNLESRRPLATARKSRVTSNDARRRVSTSPSADRRTHFSALAMRLAPARQADRALARVLLLCTCTTRCPNANDTGQGGDINQGGRSMDRKIGLLGAMLFVSGTVFAIDPENFPTFKAVDADHNGLLSREEIQIAIPEVLAVFARADLNADG